MRSTSCFLKLNEKLDFVSFKRTFSLQKDNVKKVLTFLDKKNNHRTRKIFTKHTAKDLYLESMCEIN